MRRAQTSSGPMVSSAIGSLAFSPPLAEDAAGG